MNRLSKTYDRVEIKREDIGISKPKIVLPTRIFACVSSTHTSLSLPPTIHNLWKNRKEEEKYTSFALSNNYDPDTNIRISKRKMLENEIAESFKAIISSLEPFCNDQKNKKFRKQIKEKPQNQHKKALIK